MERNIALAIARAVLRPWCIVLVVCIALLWGTFGFFFGTGGDMRRLKLRLYIDGAAPGHRFDPGSDHAGAVLSGLNLRGAQFPRVRLCKARLNDARLGKAVLEACDLAGADLKSVDARQARLFMCRLDGADLREADLTGADLSGSSFNLALLAGIKLKEANVAHADFKGAAGLPIAELRSALNWHLAVYDEGTARTIAETFQKAGLSAPGFPSWDAWILEQKKLAVSAEDMLEPGRP